MMIKFNESEICRIISYYASREMNHEIPYDEIVVEVTGKGEDRTVTASYEIDQFEDEADE